MFKLNNLKTGRRLALGFGFLTVLLLLLAGAAWWQMAAINQSMDTALVQAGKMTKIKNIKVTTDTLYLQMWSLVTAKDPAVKQARKAAIDKARENYRNGLEELRGLAKHQEDRDLLAKLEEVLAEARTLNERIIDQALKAQGQDAAAVELLSTEGEKILREKIDPAIDAAIAYRERRVQEVVTAAQGAYLWARWVLGVGALVALGLAVLFGFLITRSLVLPIRGCVGITGRLAEGDFSAEVPEVFRRRGDEIGDLTRGFHAMVSNTRKLLRDVSGGVQTLASAATELSAVSSQTAATVRSMSDKTTTVAAAAEEASANTTSVAAGMEQAATNLASVASATEEMSATVGEIAANSEKARAISERASSQAQVISTLMQQLGQAAQEIGKVTETITHISSQTNLLALNATIEAARAGAAGKGFAVVANEIKELARQTATATEDIKAKIAGVQNSASSAITDIEKISGVISEVGAIVSSIAAAIEEQATVTKDVAGNIAQASAGVRDSNERVAQTVTVSQSMAQDIARISAGVKDIHQGGEQVEASAGELSKLAEQLKATVGQFKVDQHQTATMADRARPSASPGTPSVRENPQEDTLIQWSEEYSVEVLTMDAHHQKLISLINQLYAALKRGEATTVTQAILKQVIAYTQYHFRAEEEVMAQMNYSGLAAQKKAHAEFLGVVAAARDRWVAGDNTVPEEMLATLKRWLVQHITGMDKQYAPSRVRPAGEAKASAGPSRVRQLTAPGEARGRAARKI